ncbi:hypothetical protein GCM10020254_73390 [Streptomyces goshikiensis]
MAAPHIAGLAALLKSAKPSLTPAQVESAIKNTARPLAGTCTGGCGTGLADAAAAVASVTTTTPPAGSFENTTDFAIGDNATVESPITVSGVTGNAPAALKVGVKIAHTYIGDLKVDLVAPRRQRLHAPQPDRRRHRRHQPGLHRQRLLRDRQRHLEAPRERQRGRRHRQDRLLEPRLLIRHRAGGPTPRPDAVRAAPRPG